MRIFGAAFLTTASMVKIKDVPCVHAPAGAGRSYFACDTI